MCFNRSPTDETYNPESIPDELTSPLPHTTNPLTDTYLNFSSFAKPFEKTNNSLKFRQTISKTELSDEPSPISKYVNGDSRNYNNENNKIVSLSTGFSIRRNLSNSSNPYTLTVISRPLDNYNISRKSLNGKLIPVNNKHYDISKEISHERSRQSLKYPTRRTDSSHEQFYNKEEDEGPLVYIRPNKNTNNRDSIQYPTLKPTVPSTMGPKYFLKTVIKRPAPFSTHDEQYLGSTENNIDTDILIEKGLQNAQKNNIINTSAERNSVFKSTEEPQLDLTVSPYRTLENLRKPYAGKNSNSRFDVTSLPTSTAEYISQSANKDIVENPPKVNSFPSKSYTSYKFDDNVQTDTPSGIFSNTAKQILRAFFGRVPSKTTTKLPEVTYSPSNGVSDDEEKTVNIGFKKKTFKYSEPKVTPKYIKHVEIIPETMSIDTTPLPKTYKYISEDSSMLSTTTPVTTTGPPYWNNINEVTTNVYSQTIQDDSPKILKYESTSKFMNIIKKSSSTENEYNKYDSSNNLNTEDKLLTPTDSDSTTTLYPEQNFDIMKYETKPSTKPTVTKTVPMTTTKSYSSLPTRATRVNPAIKLAATNLGGGRRSYQSTSNCSSDDSLQANPKCNEIKYQRYFYYSR